MKKTINKKALLDVVTKLGKYVSPKPAIPILENFLIHNNEVIADNQEVRITHQIPKEGDINPLSDVSVCVPAKQFITALNNMDSDTVTLKFEDGKVTISDPVNKKGIKINTFPAKDFIVPQEAKGDTVYLPVPSAHFIPALDRASTFADASRVDIYAYVGITVHDGVLHINGGSAFTAIYEMRIDIPGIKGFHALISVKGANALCEIEDLDEVTIERRGNFIFCSNSQVSIQARCMEGKYTDTRPFTKANEGAFSMIEKRMLVSASNLCSTLKSDINFICMEKVDGGVSFATHNETGEVANQHIAGENDGIADSCWYNNSNLRKCLSAISHDKVKVDNKGGILFLSPAESPIGVEEVLLVPRIVPQQ